jgi:hypothetical protein
LRRERFWALLAGVSRKYPTAERAAEPVPGSEKHLVSPRLLRPLENWLRALRRSDTHGDRTLSYEFDGIRRVSESGGPRLFGLRRGIERLFGQPVSVPYSSCVLPPWVRGLPRVRRWVTAKLLLFSFARRCRKHVG